MNLMIFLIHVAGGMKGADIGIGWVDQRGNVYFQVCILSCGQMVAKSFFVYFLQDRYAFGTSRPVIDNTTIDWFHLQGREQNGWTSIQFKRLLDTCDLMDVPIRVSDAFIYIPLKIRRFSTNIVWN